MPAGQAVRPRSKAPATLKKGRRKDRLVEDIQARVRSGELRPGDRLAPIPELAKTYGVSPRSVIGAIRELTTRDVVFTRSRSGCYIAYPPAAPAGDAPRTIASASYSSFLVPRAPKRTASLYISESFPETLAIWRQLLAEFSARHPGVDLEVRSCLDGHLQDLDPNQRFGLIHTTPPVVQALGAERFWEARAYAEMMPDVSEYLPLVEERLRRGPPVLGLPFSVTLNYLFVHRDLARESGLAPSGPATLEELFAAAGRLRAARGAEGLWGYATSGFVDELLQAGAVRPTPGGGYTFDALQAERVLRLAVEAHCRSISCLNTIPEFVAGRLLFLRHASFTAIDLRAHARIPWAVVPPPVADGVRLPGWLMVLAMARDAPPEIAELARFLTQAESQRRLAAAGGNLPARAAALFHPQVLERHPVAEAVLRRVLEQETLLWPDPMREEINARIVRCGPPDLAALHLGVPVAEVVARLAREFQG